LVVAMQIDVQSAESATVRFVSLLSWQEEAVFQIPKGACQLTITNPYAPSQMALSYSRRWAVCRIPYLGGVVVLTTFCPSMSLFRSSRTDVIVANIERLTVSRKGKYSARHSSAASI
jgi:hypothetical protein